jgi:CheY-like chemotaxis protein
MTLDNTGSLDKAEFRRSIVLAVLNGSTYAEAGRQYGVATPNARYFVHDYLRRVGIQPDERQDMSQLHAMAERLLPVIKITASLPGNEPIPDVESLPLHALKVETALVVRFRSSGIETVGDFLKMELNDALLIRSVTKDVFKTIHTLIEQTRGGGGSTDLLYRQKTVLVVEDDEVMRVTLTEVLSQAGYDVLEAGNGQQALDVFDQHHPDLVVVDLMMPEIDGFGVCSALRKRSNPAKTPIVVTTARGDDASIERAFQSGATDYFTKPIQWSVFKHRVELLMQRKPSAATA